MRSDTRLVVTVLLGFLAGYVLVITTMRPALEKESTIYSRAIRAAEPRRYEDDFKKSRISQGNFVKNRFLNQLAKDVRIVCWILTYPDNHKKKAIHVKATWGRRCNVLLFMSTGEDEDLPTVKLNIEEGWNYTWLKTREAFRYVHLHYRRQADWFLKADDDTYVVVENLRYMLASYNTSDLLYFGCQLKPDYNNGYMAGGAGYVLSRAALDKFVTVGLTSPHICSDYIHGREDAELGYCMDNMGVKSIDTRDKHKKPRFFHLQPDKYLLQQTKEKPSYISTVGAECCSKYSISFHYLQPSQMYKFEFFLYYLRAYGLESNYAIPNQEMTKTSFARELAKKLL